MEAGPGQEDRMSAGSYLALREEERTKRDAAAPKASDSFLPDFLK